MIRKETLITAVAAVAGIICTVSPRNVGLAQTGTPGAKTSSGKKSATSPAARKAAPKDAAAAPAAAPAPAANAPLAPKTIRPVDKKDFEENLRLAVLVAPKYSGSGLTPLTYTLADVTELGMELERQGYVVRVIKNNEAYSENVRNVLQQQMDLLKDSTNSTFLFAFTGHGFQLESTKKNYLVTTGVNVAPESIEKEALALDEVEKLMSATKAKRKIILIDACRNDPNARSAGVNRTMRDLQAAEGVAILLSTSPGGTSYEDPELQHGIFTNFLLEGLRGKAAGPDGLVTFNDLGGYVSKRVLAYAAKKGYSQKPFTTGERSDDFLIATAAPPKPEQVVRPQGLAQVDNEAPVLKSPDLHRSFFMPIKDDVLNLYDSSSFQPYVAGLKKIASTPDGIVRFEGPGPQPNSVMHLVVEMSGDQIKLVRGRVGIACPNETTCGTPIKLPGEPDKPADTILKACGLAGDTGGTGVFGKLRKVQTSVSPACKKAKEAVATFDSQRKYNWTSFNLTSELRKP
jgi:hypothetical protein